MVEGPPEKQMKDVCCTVKKSVMVLKTGFLSAPSIPLTFLPTKQQEDWPMKYLHFLKVVSIFTLFFATPAFAGGFAEKFKQFVLGSEAEAYALNSYDSGMDKEAEACINCHNGVTATHITTKNAEAPMHIRGSQTVNHPVGMLYDYYVSKKPMGYRPRSTLDANIRFVDGKVTCISCHELKSLDLEALDRSDELQGRTYASSNLRGNEDCTASNQLTTGSRKTDLCIACHIK